MFGGRHTGASMASDSRRGVLKAEGRGVGGASPACTSAARKAGTPSPRAQPLPWSARSAGKLCENREALGVAELKGVLTALNDYRGVSIGLSALVFTVVLFVRLSLPFRLKLIERGFHSRLYGLGLRFRFAEALADVGQDSVDLLEIGSVRVLGIMRRQELAFGTAENGGRPRRFEKLRVGILRNGMIQHEPGILGKTFEAEFSFGGHNYFQGITGNHLLRRSISIAQASGVRHLD
jgi:hypothetical protein